MKSGPFKIDRVMYGISLKIDYLCDPDKKGVNP